MAAPWLPKSDRGTRSPVSHFWHRGKLFTPTTLSLPPKRSRRSITGHPIADKVGCQHFPSTFQFSPATARRAASGLRRPPFPGILRLKHVAQRLAQRKPERLRRQRYQPPVHEEQLRQL